MNAEVERPGTLLRHEVVYSGRIFTVSRDRVRMPNGHEGTLEVVRHHGSVVLIPMPDPAHVILVRQYRYAVDQWIWELAAGSLEPNEDPTEGAARECEEETGWVPGQIELLGSFYPTPGYCDEKMNIFKLTDLKRPGPGHTAALPDEDEDIRTRVFSLDDVRDMTRRGEIPDLKTAVGLTLL
ncbi:MAG TPA: NUDIX hydrolase [Vicinamibacterales bacterium]